MNVSYKRDLNHNYMIIPCEEEKTEGYEIKMLTDNHIVGFLPFSIRHMDGSSMIYYEISSKQSMKRIFQYTEMGYDDLYSLLFQFYKMLHTAEEYLMNADHILMDPEYIYMNIESRQLFICYYPGTSMNVKEGFQQLAEYILDRVNHDDAKAVMLAYKIYKNTRNMNFTLEEILSLSASIEEQDSKLQEEEWSPSFKDDREIESIRNYERVREDRRTEREESEDCIKDQNDILKIIQKKPEIFRKESKGKKEKNVKLWYHVLLLSFLFITSIVYLKAVNLLPKSITYQQYLILLGLGAMGMAGCIIKLIIDQAKKKLEMEERENRYEDIEEMEPVERACSMIEEQENKSFVESEDEIKDSIKIYEFLTSGGNSENMVAEESVYTVGHRTNSFISEPEYVGNTMLLGTYEVEEQRELSGMCKGKQMTYSLANLPVTIGKKEDYVDIAIPDTSVSRMHARFFEKDGKVYLEDLNSTNGTFKNNVRLEANETVEVEAEDEIAFGKIVFTYH